MLTLYRPLRLKMSIKFISFFLFCLKISFCYADVKSTTGSLRFDSNNDNSTEMVLNEIGLGIGITPSSNLHVSSNAIISGDLKIGTTSTQANLALSGTLGFSHLSISGNHTLSETASHSHILVDTSQGNIFLHLPYAGNVQGRIYIIKKINLNHSLRVTGGGNYIDHSTVINMNHDSVLSSLNVISDGRNWYILQSLETEQIASDNLIGWWKLDDGFGTTVTDSISSRNGTLQNSDGDEWVPGVIGGGLDINATDTNDYVTISDDDIFDFEDTESFTVSAWIKTSINPPGTNTKFVYKRSGLTFYTLQLQAGYRPQIELRSEEGSGFNATASSNVMDGQWHHLVGGVDRTTGTSFIYVDGVLEGTNGSASGNIRTATDLQIGVSGNENLQGEIDDVRIYNKALSGEEVDGLFGQGL